MDDARRREGGRDEPARRGWPRWSREPVVHFVVLGAALFALHALVHRARARGGERDATVVVPATVVEGLRAEQTRTLGRAPTREELAGDVERWATDEVLYREALRRGLDREDEVVRRRLIQKLSLLLRDPTPPRAPSDAELEAYRAAHATRYPSPGWADVTQVFFSRARRGDAAEADARAAREALAAGADPSSLGDPFPLAAGGTVRTLPSLTADYGAAFVQAVTAAPLGAWTGPLATRYGFHVVRVGARAEPGVLSLEQARDRVRSDYLDELRAQAAREALRRVREAYRVEVHWPAEVAGP